MQVTIVNTLHLHTAGAFLTIGGPAPNTTVYVLDEDMKPVPVGEPGVMWAGGACVSKGYVNLPEKTSERYKRDPFVNDGWVFFLSLSCELRSSLMTSIGVTGATCSTPVTWEGGAIMGSSSTWAVSMIK